MSTSTELNTPLSGHTPVSNLGVETNGSSGKTLSNPPSEGPNADTPKARNLPDLIWGSTDKVLPIIIDT